MQHRIIVHSALFARTFVFLHRANRRARTPERRTSPLFLSFTGPRGGTIREQVSLPDGLVYVTEENAPEVCRKVVKAWEQQGGGVRD